MSFVRFCAISLPRWRLLVVGAGLLAALLLAGCSGSKETKSVEAPHETLAQAEDRFHPADYDRSPERVREAAEHGFNPASPDTAMPKPQTDTTRGFRVQVLFTQNIDEANRVRDTLATDLPLEYIYVVYDAPYYKVRVGNFTDRSDANDLVRILVADGYRDAWVVPDNVIVNLPSRK